MKNQKLIDRVLDFIEKDVLAGDMSAVEELIKSIPEKRLMAYLPEEEAIKFKKPNSLKYFKRK